jgi:hypothetical protein
MRDIPGAFVRAMKLNQNYVIAPQKSLSFSFNLHLLNGMQKSLVHLRSLSGDILREIRSDGPKYDEESRPDTI